jgi:hypothetical protein
MASAPRPEWAGAAPPCVLRATIQASPVDAGGEAHPPGEIRERSMSEMTSATTRMGEMWTCRECGRAFANRNQPHACGRYDLEAHFTDKPPEIRALFDALLARVVACGPVRVLPEKTRIAFQVRMSFAAAIPRRGWLDGHLVLARRVERPLFRRIDSLSPRNHVHLFRLRSAADLTPEFDALLREAYAVGEQKHLAPPRTL